MEIFIDIQLQSNRPEGYILLGTSLETCASDGDRERLLESLYNAPAMLTFGQIPIPSCLKRKNTFEPVIFLSLHMHLNYYFLRFLSQELQEKLIGFTLTECYLQNRYECIIGLHNNEEEFFIKLNLYNEFTCLAFPGEFSKSKKGTYNVFKELKDQKITTIIQHENDRSFHIVFENEYSLLFKLYGSRSNLLLFYKNNCVDLLNKNLVPDREIDLANIHKKTNQTYENFLSEKGNISALFPAFDKEIFSQLYLMDYEKKNNEGKWDTIQELLKTFQIKKFILKSIPPFFKLSFFPSDKIIATTNSAIEAANYFERYAGQSFYFQKEKKEILHYLEQKLKKNTLYISTIETKYKALQEQTRYDEIANILMANLHQIPSHTKNIELFNFYTEQPIRINLKKELSPQKNAENYYRKSKNQKIEIAELEKNILRKEQEKETFLVQLNFIETCEDLKTLRKYSKEHTLLLDKVSKEKEQENLFKRFQI
ncbi:MAG TPA: NFACT family protein, partial [Cytophagaceae bacterium]|nr:NFACT family protein [Cytophagaceae bacterium]